MRCESWRYEIWLFAAGELPAGECEALWSHLGACDPCTRELAAAHRVFENDSQSLPPVAPPASLREQLLARIRRERSATATLKRKSTRRRVAALATAAALGALLGGSATALWLGSLRPSESDGRLEMADLRQRMSDLEERFHPPSVVDATELAPGVELAEAWVTPLEAAQGRRRGMNVEVGFDSRVDTSARVFCLETEALCGFRAAGLPTPAPGQSYALWLTNLVGRYYLVGTFEVDAYGNATMLASAPVDIRNVARSVVTLEPGEAGWRPMGSVVMVEGQFADAGIDPN